MTSPTNDTPGTELTATRTKPANTPIDVHPTAAAIAVACADPERNPLLVPHVEASPPGGYQDTGPDTPRTRRGWPIETPTWQGVEI